MKLISTDTKTFKVFQALQAGEALTAAAANSRFGVKNLAAEVSRVRNSGHPVYTNLRTDGNGSMVTEYVLGRASRKLVALGYKAQRLGITLD